MKVLNLSNLLKKGKITQSEFEKYSNLSKENVPNNLYDTLYGVGFLCLGYGFIVFYIDGLREQMDRVMLLEGVVSVGFGLWLVRFRPHRMLISAIFLVSGVLLLVLTFIDFMGKGWAWLFHT